MADMQRIETMLAAIQLGVTLDQARQQKLVRTAEEADIFRELEREVTDLLRKGQKVATPQTLI